MRSLLRALAIAATVVACTLILLAASALFLAKAIAARIVAAGLAAMLQGLVTYLYAMAVLEVSMAAVVWATKGPILAAAWVGERASAWRAP